MFVLALAAAVFTGCKNSGEKSEKKAETEMHEGHDHDKGHDAHAGHDHDGHGHEGHNHEHDKGHDETLAASTFKVYGNCGMCEERIEKAANAVEGVANADWDVDSKQMEVRFDAEKTNAEAIHAAIAAIGHDTEQVKADDATYEGLHGCCQYDRAE